MAEQNFVYVDANYLKELEETAKKVDYYKGIIDGINMVIDHKDEPQTETSTNNSTISEKLQLTKCDLCKREGGDVCVDCERKKQSGKE